MLRRWTTVRKTRPYKVPCYNCVTVWLMSMACVVCAGLWYLIAAFVAGEWDSTEWESLPKVFLVLFWIISSVASCAGILRLRGILIPSNHR